MPRLLAELSDIERWLASDKFAVLDSNTSAFQIEANRIIKGKLFGVFSAVILFGWSSPENTPELIRSIAGKLIASYLYKEVYSEDSLEVPPYAQELYDQAIADLDAIRAGTLTVFDEDGNPIGNELASLTAADFYPNDKADGPYFSMGKEFA